jgi:hypothetical protein
LGQSKIEYPHSPCGDENWVTYKDEKCFKLIDDFKTRDEAEKICNQLLYTDLSIPTLVSIKSTAEQDYLNEFLYNQLKIVDTVWIAAKRLEGNSSQFEWNDGPLADFTNWAEGSTVDEDDRNCVEMRPANAINKSSIPEPSIDVSNGKWVKVKCEKRNLVLCQKLQTWSFLHFQKTFLNTRKEIKDSFEEVTKKLDSTTNQLSDTRKELENTRNQLSTTKNELTDTKIDLISSKNNLRSTINDLETTRNQLNHIQQNPGKIKKHRTI